MTLIWGIVLGSLGLVHWGPVLVAGLTITSITYGAMLGVFLLGMWNRRANATGAIVGMLFGLGTMVAVNRFTTLAWTWYVLVGTVVTFAAGSIASAISAGGLNPKADSVEAERCERMSAGSGTKRLELVRGLGVWAASAIVVGTMVGTGIFLKPSQMASEGGSVSVVYAAWIVGGLLSLFGALSFAELGAAIPEAGGQYAYLSRGLGPVWGFLFGWMHSTVGESSSAASIAAGFARFLSVFVPVIAAPIFTLHFTVPFSGKPFEFAFTWAQPVAVGALAVFTVINYLGVRVGGRVQVALTAIKVASILAIVAAAFAFRPRQLFEFSSVLAHQNRHRDILKFSRGAGCGALGLRRLGRFESRRIGSRKSAEKFSDRDGGRDDSGRRHLSGVQCSLFLRAAVRERGRIAACGLGCRSKLRW